MTAGGGGRLGVAGGQAPVRARPAGAGSGRRCWCSPVGGQGSHLVADLAGADCLAVVGEEVEAVRPGDELECIPLRDAGDSDRAG